MNADKTGIKLWSKLINNNSLKKTAGGKKKQILIFAAFPDQRKMKSQDVGCSRLPVARRDRIVVSTLRCGRNNPGSNPGHGIVRQCYGRWAPFVFTNS